MSNTPEVSVVMPVHNGGRWLGAAVDSILAQSFASLELIIVDDHSSDDAVARLARDDPRLRILQSPGRGIVAALNHGIAHSRGRFIARMDADDISLPMRIATQRDYLLRHPGVGISGARVEIFGAEAGTPAAEGYRVYQSWINELISPADIAREIFIESPIPHPTAMLRREVLLELGGYRDTPWAEDYDLWLRAHLAGILMGKPEAVLLHWRDHEGRLSRRSGRYSRRQFIAARACYLAKRYARAEQLVIWGAGENGKRLCDALAAHGIHVAAFIDVSPRLVGGRKRGVPVLPMAAIEELDAAFIIVAVARRGARGEIRDYLHARGRREGGDFIFAA